METCRKKSEGKKAYNTTYGLALVEDGGDGFVYFKGASHLVRDLCIRHKFAKVAAAPKVNKVEPEPKIEESVTVEKPKPRRKPRRSKSSDK